MSIKTVIQTLEDTQLIRTFLDFVQTFHLQYQKIHKEISYKCFEATWILASTKATGYGRTESEAYKHALRNLLQALIEEPIYTAFFIDTLTVCGAIPRVSVKKKEKENSRPQYLKMELPDKEIKAEGSGHGNGNGNGNGNRKEHMRSDLLLRNEQIKTEGMEPVEQHRENASTKKLILESYGKGHQGSTKKHPIDVKKDKKQVYHSKINLNRSLYQNKPESSQQPTECSQSEELEKARKKLKDLESKLSQVNHENESLRKILKERSNNHDHPQNEVKIQRERSVTLFQKFDRHHPKPEVKDKSKQVAEIHEKEKEKQKQKEREKEKEKERQKEREKENHVERCSKPKYLAAKMPVPKLHLEILPNYHKKAEKSLNQSLMAAYNQKHGTKELL